MVGDIVKCSIEGFGGAICNRPIYEPDGSRCICHSDKAGKDTSLFYQELESLFRKQDARIYDLVGFVFPQDFNGLVLPRKYGKDVSYRGAIFLGDVFFAPADFLGADFIGTEFKGEAIFTGCGFTEVAHFNKVVFHKKASFDRCELSDDVYFSGAIFHGDVSFWRAKLLKRGRLHFDGVAEDGSQTEVFRAESDFRALSIAEGSQVFLRRVDLSKCRLQDTDLSHVKFIGVTWPRCLRWPGTWLEKCFLSRRLVTRLGWFNFVSVYEEGLVEESIRRDESKKHTVGPIGRSREWTSLAELYRQLQRNYVDSYRYLDAGGFYVGEQEAIRQDSGKIYRYLCLNNGYRLASYYGQSVLLPLVWLFFTFLLFPLYQILDGIKLGSDNLFTNYDLSFPGEFLFFSTDYWRTVAKNLQLVTLNHGDVAECLPELYQQFFLTIETLWVIVLTAFFVLALRRRFRRKSF